MLSWGPVAGQRLGAACNWGIASRSSTSLAGGLWFCRTWCLWMKMKRTPSILEIQTGSTSFDFQKSLDHPKSFSYEFLWSWDDLSLISGSIPGTNIRTEPGTSCSTMVRCWQFGARSSRGCGARPDGGGRKRQHPLIPSHPPWRSWNRQDMPDISWHILHVMYDNDESMLHAVHMIHDAMWYRRNTVCKWFVFCIMSLYVIII